MITLVEKLLLQNFTFASGPNGTIGITTVLVNNGVVAINAGLYALSIYEGDASAPDTSRLIQTYESTGFYASI